MYYIYMYGSVRAILTYRVYQLYDGMLATKHEYPISVLMQYTRSVLLDLCREGRSVVATPRLLVHLHDRSINDQQMHSWSSSQ